MIHEFGRVCKIREQVGGKCCQKQSDAECRLWSDDLIYLFIWREVGGNENYLVTWVLNSQQKSAMNIDCYKLMYKEAKC